MPIVRFTEKHCIVLCDMGHLIASESLDGFTNTRLYEEVGKYQQGERSKLDEWAEKCSGFGHNPLSTKEGR